MTVALLVTVLCKWVALQWTAAGCRKAGMDHAEFMMLYCFGAGCRRLGVWMFSAVGVVVLERSPMYFAAAARSRMPRFAGLAGSCNCPQCACYVHYTQAVPTACDSLWQ